MKRDEAVRDLPAIQAPRCVQGPWAVPRAVAPRPPLLGSRDEMPASQQPPEPSSQTHLRYPAAEAGLKKLPAAAALASV